MHETFAMSIPAEELHKQSLDILAKLATCKEYGNVEITENISNIIWKTCTCAQNNCCGNCNKENLLKGESSVCEKAQLTPQKCNTPHDPVTPTANLKMLVSAASDLQPASTTKEDGNDLTTMQVTDDTHCLPEYSDDNAGQKVKLKRGELMGRKEKSLGLLCKKFMCIYPEFSPLGTTVMLDDVVKSLCIGRRRVYDIVNVLESMEMMVRQAKNKYIWFGKSRLPATLSKLKALALRVYGTKFSRTLRRYIQPRVKGDKNCFILPKADAIKQTPDEQDPTNSCTYAVEELEGCNQPKVDDLTRSIMDSIILYDHVKRDSNRSLGILCQKFIMLFMVAEDNTVSLDRAAKLLITDPEEGSGKYKTKVRRLYDIANILTSINFLEKCALYEDATKKAAYKWIGLNLNLINCEESACKAFLSQEFSLTRHSLLTPAPIVAPECSKLSQSTTNQEDSPNQVLFQQKLLSLQREFPDKLPTNCLVDLLTACKDNPSKGKSSMPSRRRLSSDFDCQPKERPPKKARVVDEENRSKIKKTSSVPQLPDSQTKDLSLNFPTPLASTPANVVNSVNSGSTNVSNSVKGKLVENNVIINPVKEKLMESKIFIPSNEKFENYVSNPARGKLIEKKVLNKILAPVSGKLLNGNIILNSPNGKLIENKLINPVNGKLMENKVLISSENIIEKNVNNTWQQPAYFTIPATLQPVAKPGDPAQSITTMLVSPLSNPISIPKSGLYQIIPVQCHTVVERNEPVISSVQPMVARSVTSNSEVNKTAEKSSVPVLIHPAAVSATSTTVSISPTPSSLKSFTDSPVHYQQLDGNYQELVTPPHVLHRQFNKPPANPIIFPKMTPETPSSNGQISQAVLTNVTRKLMSLQQDDNL